MKGGCQGQPKCEFGERERESARGRPTKVLAGGLVRFLFNKGDLMDIRCYRPVCLLDTVHQVLSGNLTDGLLDPSQEGFRRLRSCQRQAQGLPQAIEETPPPPCVAYLEPGRPWEKQ